MINNNKKIGNTKEKVVANELSRLGYWCHIFAQTKQGQPFDLIAIKNNIVIMGDVKSCLKGRFDFSRIEPNQYTAMELALQKGNTNIYFFLVDEENNIKVIKYQTIKEFSKKSLTKSINLSLLSELWEVV